MSGRRGASLLELILALAVIGATLVVALPRVDRITRVSRAAAGARQLATAFQAARWRSVMEGEGNGLLFSRDPAGWSWLEVVDGNGNGLRSAEIARGVDPIVGGPHRLGDLVEGLGLGFPSAGEYPNVPPGSGRIEDLADPIQFGNSDLIAFTPRGTGSSGTAYVTDGQQVFAIVLYGRTARQSVWRFDERTRQWKR